MKQKQEVREDDLQAEEWNFSKRIVLDMASHRSQCAQCRKGKPKLGPDEKYYGVKNKSTREYQHVVAQDSQAAKEALGWLIDDCWVILLEDGKKSGPMSEETKARLREYTKKRRGDRPPAAPRPVNPNRPICHEHCCPSCGSTYFHTTNAAEACERGPHERACIQCEVSEGVLTEPASRGIMVTHDEINPNEEGGDIMSKATDIKTFVREFIDSQVMDKGEDGKPELNMDKLFNLAKAQDLDVGKYRKDAKENPGRIRMTLGNMIRGAAVRHGKLTTLGGASKTVPTELLPPKKEKKAKVEKKAKAA